jgi:hypothetical protein
MVGRRNCESRTDTESSKEELAVCGTLDTTTTFLHLRKSGFLPHEGEGTYIKQLLD